MSQGSFVEEVSLSHTISIEVIKVEEAVPLIAIHVYSLEKLYVAPDEVALMLVKAVPVALLV